MHKERPVIVWFRQDLRLSDNPALHQGIDSGRIIPLYILDEKAAGRWKTGGAQCWALHHALQGLDDSLRKTGSRLILRRGDAATLLPALIKETHARAVYWNRRYEPLGIQQDIAIKKQLMDDGIEVESFNGRLLNEPWEIKNGSGNPYKVFTPYWRKVEEILSQKPPAVFPTPRKIPGPAEWPKSDHLQDWNLLPSKPDWTGGFHWEMNEKAAHKILRDFMNDPLLHYSAERDFPDKPGTSHLSPYLALGKISPKQIWNDIQLAMHDGRISPAHHSEGEKFLRQIVWREFSYHLLFHFPHTDHKPLNPQFENFPWRSNKKELRAWQQGETGYPLVDAGMRQLWQTGWMHNRVRMVVASFLIKHLLLPWQEGADWFWDTLIDADLANNTKGWQWVAGSGADAAPYFRIFNPMTQSEKFDKHGDYIRRFVPELATLPDKYIHAPFKAPKEILAAAKITLGKDYPEPIVDHELGRKRALEALQQSKIR